MIYVPLGYSDPAVMDMTAPLGGGPWGMSATFSLAFSLNFMTFQVLELWLDMTVLVNHQRLS